MEKQQISGRDRRFLTWSTADALMMKTGQPFEQVLATAIAMSPVPLTSTDIRSVQELQERHIGIRNLVLGPPAVAAVATPAVAAAVAEPVADSVRAPSEPPPEEVVPDLEDDISLDDADRETRLLGARDLVVSYLNWNRELPCHAIPFPKLGVTFFMVGKITIDGDAREWNHNGKHAKFKALIPSCDSKIICLNGETFPRSNFFEDWTWQVHEKEPRTKCSGNLKVFCLKHEVEAEYICWVNPGGKGDPWRFNYRMKSWGLELSRFKLKPGTKEDYIRLDPKPVLIRPIDFNKIDLSTPKA